MCQALTEPELYPGCLGYPVTVTSSNNPEAPQSITGIYTASSPNAQVGYNTSHTELGLKTARNYTLGTPCDGLWNQLTKLHDSDTSQWHTVMCNSAHLQWPTSNTTHNQGNSHTPTHTSALSQHSSLTSASSDTHLPTHTHHNIECQHTHNTLNSATHKLTGKSLSYTSPYPIFNFFSNRN